MVWLLATFAGNQPTGVFIIQVPLIKRDIHDVVNHFIEWQCTEYATELMLFVVTALLRQAAEEYANRWAASAIDMITWCYLIYLLQHISTSALYALLYYHDVRFPMGQP